MIQHSYIYQNCLFFLLTSYSTAPRVISSCNVKLELEKRKVACEAEVIIVKELDTFSELLQRAADGEESGTPWMERRL